MKGLVEGSSYIVIIRFENLFVKSKRLFDNELALSARFHGEERDDLRIRKPSPGPLPARYEGGVESGESDGGGTLEVEARALTVVSRLAVGTGSLAAKATRLVTKRAEPEQKQNRLALSL